MEQKFDEKFQVKIGTWDRVDKVDKAVFTENKNSSEYSDTYGQTIKR